MHHLFLFHPLRSFSHSPCCQEFLTPFVLIRRGRVLLRHWLIVALKASTLYGWICHISRNNNQFPYTISHYKSIMTARQRPTISRRSALSLIHTIRHKAQFNCCFVVENIVKVLCCHYHRWAKMSVCGVIAEHWIELLIKRIKISIWEWQKNFYDR